MPENQGALPPAAKIVGVIDIGSNSVRMVIAQVHPDGHVEPLEQTQRSVRLGHSTFLTGRLNQQTMNAAIAILRDYRRILDVYKVEQVHAVATSAVREASNSDAFVDRVAMATDFDIEVIEPTEETRLTVSAVRHAIGDAFSINQGRALIVEIGGGSGLLTILEEGEITQSESYNLGSIRLQELLDTANQRPDRAADLLRHQIRNIVSAIKRTTPLASVESFVAIGGDARFAAQQVGEATDRPGLHVIASARFDELVSKCLPHTAEELTRAFGLSFVNAETLVPALLAYQALLHACRADQMLVSDVSMRDGLLLDLARNLTGQQDTQINESILQAAQSLGEKYAYDAGHAERVAALSLRLFDEMAPEHRLGPRHRLLLHVAALLHEIGGFVSGRSHHKHSHYLIANSIIFGLRREEQLLVAHVARYHRRSVPQPSHLDYMNLPRKQRMIVNKLAAILRVADALDRGQALISRDCIFERRNDELIIYVPGIVDLSLEKRALASKGNLFVDAYGMTVRLEEDSAARAAAHAPTA